MCSSFHFSCFLVIRNGLKIRKTLLHILAHLPIVHEIFFFFAPGPCEPIGLQFGPWLVDLCNLVLQRHIDLTSFLIVEWDNWGYYGSEYSLVCLHTSWIKARFYTNLTSMTQNYGFIEGYFVSLSSSYASHWKLNCAALQVFVLPLFLFSCYKEWSNDQLNFAIYSSPFANCSREFFIFCSRPILAYWVIVLSMVSRLMQLGFANAYRFDHIFSSGVGRLGLLWI